MFLTCAGVTNTLSDSHVSFGPLKSFEVLTIFNTEFQEKILSGLFFYERLLVRKMVVFVLGFGFLGFFVGVFL